MNLIRAIATAPWMLDARWTDMHMPLAVKLLQGEPVTFPMQKTENLRAFNMKTGQVFEFTEEDEETFGELPAVKKSIVMVYPVKGVVTKEDQMCGPRGTETLMRRLKNYDNDPAVIGHLLEIDSGGGEATNIETVARTIRGLSKPVVAWFNGIAASAAYYMATGAAEIYAGEETDEVGSIGVLVSFADLRPFWEEQGVKFHEVYAKQSDLKNKDFRDALAGDYDELREKFLNPYAERFIKTVKEFRPNLKEKDAYRGALYMAPEAIEMGMIDGILTIENAAKRVYELGKERDDKEMNFNNQNHTNMKGFNFFTKPDAGASEQPGATQEDLLLEQMFINMEAGINEMKNAIADLRAELEALKADMSTRMTGAENILAEIPAASAAKAKVAEDPALLQSVQADPLDEFEAATAEVAKNGAFFRIN